MHKKLLRSTIWLFFIGAFLILSSFIGCGHRSPIPLGLSINLSGYSGTPAEDIEAGARLGVNEINEAGGINGRPLELLVEDDKNTKEGILEADERLISKGCPVIIGHTYSQNTLIAYPLVMEKKRILFTAYTATTKLSKKDDLFFRTSVDNVLYGKAFGKLFEEDGLKSLLFIMDMSNSSFCKDLEKEIKRNFKGKYFEVQINTKEGVDYTQKVEEVLAYGPQAVVFLTEVKATGIFAQKLRQKGYNGRFFATLWSQGPRLFEYGSRAVDGLEIVTFLKPFYKDKLFEAFSRSLRAKFGREPTPKSARAFEAVKIISQVMKSCSDPTDVYCLKKELLRQRFNFLLGEVKFNRFGDVIRPIYLIKAQNRKFVLVRRIF